MAKKIYLGINDKARRVRRAYLGLLPATNLISNGSFETTSNWATWSGDSSFDTSVALYGSKSLKLTGDNLASTSISTPIVGHKYYAREYIKTDGDIQPTDCRFEIHGGDGEGLNWVFGWNRGNYPDWTMLSDIQTINSVNASSYVIRTFALGATGNIWIDGLMLLDLTAIYGAGNEPSKEWCDINIFFFEGNGGVSSPNDTDGIAHRIKKGYIGIGGVARPFLGEGVEYYGIKNLPGSTQKPGVTTVGEYALIGGGFGNTSIYAYDKSLTRISPPSMTYQRSNLAATTVGNYALFAGGYQGSVVRSDIEVYNESLTKRSSLLSLTTGRKSLFGITLEDYALFVCGSTGSGYSNNIDIYNSSLTKQTDKTLESKISVAGAISSNETRQYAIFAGGQTSNGYSNDISILSNSLSWVTSSAGTLTTAGTFSGASVGGKAIFAAGWCGYLANECYYFTGTTKSFLSNDVASKRFDCITTTIKNYALFAGGRYDYSYCAKEVNAFDNLLTRTSLASLSSDKWKMGATTLGNYALFAGGLTSSSTSDWTNEVEIYELFE